MKFIILIYCLLATISGYSQERAVELIREYDDEKKEYKIYVNNESYSSQIVTFIFKDAQNIKCQDGRVEITKTIKRGRRILFTKISASDPTSRFNFGYSYTYTPGNNRPKPDFDHPYLFPIKPGNLTTSRAMTYLNTEYGKEEKPKDFYSLTFSTSIGDTIFASRGGIVTLIADNKHKNKGEGLLFDRNSNYLTVEHKDGTYANYRLFKNDGFFVKEGNQVIPGQPLGIVSGKDYANGSHLQFNVRYYHKSKNEDRKSNWAYVKLHFLTEEGVQEIECKKPYKSVITEEAITFEMSRREKKKYVKGRK